MLTLATNVLLLSQDKESEIHNKQREDFIMTEVSYIYDELDELLSTIEEDSLQGFSISTENIYD